MVGTQYINIFTVLKTFTALKQPYLIFEILNNFEYQKLDRHLQAGLSASRETILWFELATQLNCHRQNLE